MYGCCSGQIVAPLESRKGLFITHNFETQLLDIDIVKYDSNTAFHCETRSFSQEISVCCYQVQMMELLYGFDSLSALLLITKCTAAAQARLLHHLSLEKHHGLWHS